MKTQGKEQLVDYSISHVVISHQYLAIFKQKGGEQFHNNFKASYQVPPLGLRRPNLGFTSK
jgi:hypothetical protein